MHWIREFLRDLRFGARSLLRTPATAFLAIAMLALGIGANAAMFTVVNAAFLRPLPYPDAARLVRVTGIFTNNTSDEVTLTPDFLAWREHARSFERIAAYDGRGRNITGVGDPMPVETLRASSDFLPLLRIAPALGRNFLAQEDDRDRGRVAILTHRFWSSVFASDRDVLGRTISVDGEPHEIVGVLPAGALLPLSAGIDLLTPFGRDLAMEMRRGEGITFTRNVVGRLKDGVTVEQAVAELAAIQAGLPRPAGFPRTSRFSVTAIPFQTHLMGNVRAASLALLGAVSFVLLIACANVANLLLVRAAARRREMSVRAALGGSRSRLIRQLLAESAVLAGAAFACGLPVAPWVRRLLLWISPVSAPGFADFGIDGRVLAFTAVCSILAAFAFGLAPALQGSRVAFGGVLRSSAGSTPSARRWLNALAAGELALAVVLLSGACTMLDLFWRLRYGSLGFRSEQLVVATIQLPRARYPEPARQIEFLGRVLERVRAAPGVESATIMERQALPPGQGVSVNQIAIEGVDAPVGSRPVAAHPGVSPGYFRTLGIPIVRGRDVLDSDNGTALPVAVVNRVFANRYFAGADPIGRRIRVGSRTQPWRTVVGIAGDAKSAGLVAPPQPMVYLPLDQSGALDAAIAVRTVLGPESIAAGLRNAVKESDPSLAVGGIAAMQDALDMSARLPRFATSVLAAFAALALILSAAGIYGVMSCAVGWRTREIGIRCALGAGRGQILSGVLSQGVRILLAGSVCGLAGVLALGQVLRALVHNTGEAVSLWPVALAVAVLGLAALGACYIPARRAARMDPAAALRHE